MKGTSPMEKEKTQAELLSEKLMLKKEHFSKAMSDEEIAKADAFCEGYKTFLTEAKTERESETLSVRCAFFSFCAVFFFFCSLCCSCCFVLNFH